MFITGAALMLLDSAIVISIGVLMFPILRPHNKAIAAGYLGTRIVEGVSLAIGVVSLIVLTGPAAISANFIAYNVAMAALGIGSLFFCALLFRARLVPRFLAVWGFLGYACFAVGSLLELFGVAGAGLVAAIPGGLFEVTFGIWLIARGFRSTATADQAHPENPGDPAPGSSHQQPIPAPIHPPKREGKPVMTSALQPGIASPTRTAVKLPTVTSTRVPGARNRTAPRQQHRRRRPQGPMGLFRCAWRGRPASCTW